MNLITRTTFNLFIQTQKTPNPNFLKFIPVSKLVMGENDTVDISSLEDASRISPLARKLFRVSGVTRVFYGKNYISIAKQEQCNWNEVKPLLYELIQQHYESGEPLIVDRSEEDLGIEQTDTQTVKMIKQILSSRIRPFVQDDGGDVKFVSFDEDSGTLLLEMLGSCSGCPSSGATLRNGILKAMTYYVGEVKNVKSTEELAAEKKQQSNIDAESSKQSQVK